MSFWQALAAEPQSPLQTRLREFRARHAEQWQRWAPGRYRRPFGPRAAWNVPLRLLRPAAEQEPWVTRLWEHSTANRPGNFNLSFEEYTYPVYRTAAGLAEFPVRAKWPGNLAGSHLPWDPAWKPAAGEDAQVIVLDPATGREWDLFQVRFDGAAIGVTNGNLVRGDYRTKEDGFYPSRGCGIPYLAMLVVPEEIMAGAIEHALSMPIRQAQRGQFVAPAIKTDGTAPEGVPEGMRFALRVSDAEIEQWAATLPKATRYAACVIAVALRDYGWMITDAAGGAHLQFEARAGAGEKWTALGLDATPDDSHGRRYPRDLLDGLLTRERIYVVQTADEYPPSLRPENTPGIR